MTDKLSQIIQDARPKSAESSIKAYKRLISKIMLAHPNMIDDPDDTSWVNDTQYILKVIKDMDVKDSTARNYYVALMIYIEGVNGGANDVALWSTFPEYMIYDNLVKKVNDEYKVSKETNSLTPSQQEQFMTATELHSRVKTMKSQANRIMAKHGGENGNPNPPDKEYSFAMAYVLLNIYLELPVRNEIATLKYISKRQFNKQSKLPSNPLTMKHNYIIIEKSKSTIIRNNYKTNESHGAKTDIVSKELRTILNKWFKYIGLDPKMTYHNDGDDNGFHIFPTLQPNPDSTTSTPELNLTKFLQRFTEKEFKKKMSTTILAKIYMSGKIDPELSKKVLEIAKVRGTTPTVLLPVYGNTME